MELLKPLLSHERLIHPRLLGHDPPSLLAYRLETEAASRQRRWARETHTVEPPFDITKLGIHSSKEWAYFLESVGWRRNIFKELDIPDTPENRINLVASCFLSVFYERFPNCIENEKIARFPQFSLPEELPAYLINFLKMPEEALVNASQLLGGAKEEINFSLDPTCLTRHLVRAGDLARIIGMSISESTSRPAGKKLQQEIEQLGFKDALNVIGLLHDIGRLVGHTSKHEDYTQEIVRAIFSPELAKTIGQSIHQPAPADHKLMEEDVATFDNPIQIVSRVADLFGKVKTDPNLSLRNADEILAYSRERQNLLAKAEGRPEEQTETYLANEKAVLEHALRKLDEVGVGWNVIIGLINMSRDESNEYLYGSSANPNWQFMMTWR